VVTTYEIAMADRPVLAKVPWKFLVVDEAHRLKNKHSRLLNELKMIRFDHVVLLTGTPLQNNTEELWTLLNFIDPAKFEYVTLLLSLSISRN
jgi:SNF2 family DNA or RNA helicase